MTEEVFVANLEHYFKNKNYLTGTEIKSIHGIPDLVLGKPNSKNVRLRQKHKQVEPLLNEKYFRILKFIPDIKSNRKPADIYMLANKTDISTSYLRTKLLRQLEEGGYIVAVDKGYMKINGWVPILNKVIGIEAKLKDWQRGIYQAMRYRVFADEIYLAMPPQANHLVDREVLKKFNVGLMIYDPQKNKVIKKIKPSSRKMDDNAVRNYVSEFLISGSF